MIRRALARAAACALALTAPHAARATTIAPPPCVGALPLYTRIGTLADVDGTHRRPADVEGRLAILRFGAHARAVRVGYAYVDGEGDEWVALVPGDARAARDWHRAAPGAGRHVPAYARIERVGIPHGYRLTACAP